MTTREVWIEGEWRAAENPTGTFRGIHALTGEASAQEYPICGWDDCEHALSAAACAAMDLREATGQQRADFLEAYAGEIEKVATELVESAHVESALPKSPRLADVELPRTLTQLRQGATAAREGSWAKPTIDTTLGLRAQLEPVGLVWVFGPNNFPFAFGSVSGGDFVSAITAGCPVIAKAHPSHPETTRLFALACERALKGSALPASTVQLLYAIDNEVGERCVADRRVGATAFTGSRASGLRLKEAADRAGRLIYLELSSVNPVVILPTVLRERATELAQEVSASCLLGAGQFCTSPGLLFYVDGDGAEGSNGADAFVQGIRDGFAQSPPGALLSEGVATGLAATVAQLRQVGAECLEGGEVAEGVGYRFANTLLRVTGAQFLNAPQRFQEEAFGNAALLVACASVDELQRAINTLEGNLTGSIYSQGEEDERLYPAVAALLRPRVGRLLNDKMPTGVALSPAMQHGGPYPSSGHPGFTAVGIPASVLRFGMWAAYDNVRPERLPLALRDANPIDDMWRCIDGRWTQEDV